MTPFEKAKNEAVEEYTGFPRKDWTGEIGHYGKAFSEGADWGREYERKNGDSVTGYMVGYAAAKQEDRQTIEELVNVLELVRSQMCWERDRDQLSMGLCDLHTSVTEALAKFKAGKGDV